MENTDELKNALNEFQNEGVLVKQLKSDDGNIGDLNKERCTEGSVNTCSPKPTLRELFEKEEPTNGIKLPEWDGFWFKSGDVVYVFTKEHQLLNSPQYEKYGDRTDWENIGGETSWAEPFLKTNRVRIDEIIQKVELHLSANRATSMAKTKLREAFMWIGIELGHIGSVNPYPKSMDAGSPIIEKPADLKISSESGLMEALGRLDETGVTKQLRLEIQHSLNIIRWYLRAGIPKKEEGYPAYMAIDKALVEAKLWLGQHLNYIRIRQLNNSLNNNLTGAPSGMTTHQYLARRLYDVYCEAVGGKAFNGDPLPKSEEFFNDESKRKQANAWLAASGEAFSFFNSK